MNNEPKEPLEKPRRHFLRRTLLTLASLVTLVLVFYTEEDWRGWRAWQRYERECAAKGVKLDLAALIPAPGPRGRAPPGDRPCLWL